MLKQSAKTSKVHSKHNAKTKIPLNPSNPFQAHKKDVHDQSAYHDHDRRRLLNKVDNSKDPYKSVGLLYCEGIQVEVDNGD